MAMRILLVNDDGPPSEVSPYFVPFFTTLRGRCHVVRVVIPDKPLSWIGKAHAVGKSLTCSVVCPFVLSGERRCPAGSDRDCEEHCWTFLDGSPASCTQVGLFHSAWSSDDIDLVISGPNHGRNASTIYNLSSGTVGGAMEGALCGKRAISLSFGSKEPQPHDITLAACVRAVDLIEHLWRKWDKNVEVYNINVPMVKTVATAPAVYTSPTRAYWSKGSLFSELSSEKSTSLRLADSTVPVKRRKTLKWAPEMADIKKAAKLSALDEDLRASVDQQISVTGFQANFACVGQKAGSVE